MKKKTINREVQKSNSKSILDEVTLNSLEDSEFPAIKEIVKDAKQKISLPDAETTWRKKWGRKV